MENVKVTFQVIPNDNAPISYQFLNCHIVFDIQMEDFYRKAHLVVGGNVTHKLDVITYFILFIRKMVHIALTMAALYDLEAKTADILNAHVMALNRKKF